MAYRSSAGPQLGAAPITSATPATALITQIEAAFDVHDNWDFVEEVVIATFTHRVWKNRGSGLGANSFGSDFYVALRRATDGTGNVRLQTFEAWDAVNKRAIRPVVGGSGGANITINANFSHGSEAIDGTGGFVLSNESRVMYAELVTNTVGFDWQLLVTNSVLIVGTKTSTTDHGVYCGLFDSLLAADPFPLCMGAKNSEENVWDGDFGTSRHPNKTVAATYNFTWRLLGWTIHSGSPETNDLLIGGALLARAVVSNTANDPVLFGRHRGLLKHCAFIPDGTNATRNGDAMQIGNPVSTWTKIKLGTYGLAAGVWIDQSAV